VKTETMDDDPLPFLPPNLKVYLLQIGMKEGSGKFEEYLCGEDES
jgi:hypothetical protein